MKNNKLDMIILHMFKILKKEHYNHNTNDIVDNSISQIFPKIISFPKIKYKFCY